MSDQSLKATLKLLKELGFDEFYLPKEIDNVPPLEINKTVPKEEKPNNQPSTGQETEAQKREENKNLPDKVILLDKLYEENKNCCRCELCKNRTQIVFYDGDPYSKVMFVGEAPGEDEDKQGKPFVGRAGQYLNRVLEKLNWDRSKIYITNVCKCRPPGNRKPKPLEMQTCMSVFLKKELQIVKPKVVCCLGATAAEAFLGKQVRITKERGKFMPNPLFMESKLFLTYHPAYVLRNPSAGKIFEEDLKRLKEFVENL
jgi:DNA polymerase